MLRVVQKTSAPDLVGNKQAVTAVKANAERREANLRAIVDDLRSQGFTSVRAIAAHLNERCILTRRGGPVSTARLAVATTSVTTQAHMKAADHNGSLSRSDLPEMTPAPCFAKSRIKPPKLLR
jgi:hypothetical protein